LVDQPAGIENVGQQGEAVLDNQENIDIADEEPVKPARQSIPAEMKLHEKQIPEELPQASGKNVFADQNYSIQVGAFSDFTNAQKYSEKFAKLGYQTEIIVENINQKKLHTVRVGSFVSLQEAQKEKDRLEGLEKKKFKIKKGH
jgi:cell division septation protein DedD